MLYFCGFTFAPMRLNCAISAASPISVAWPAKRSSAALMRSLDADATISAGWVVPQPAMMATISNAEARLSSFIAGDAEVRPLPITVPTPAPSRTDSAERWPVPPAEAA